MITILIPTFNRPLFLKRLLHYYVSVDCSLSIFIADSSSFPTVREENDKLIASLKDRLPLIYQQYDAEITLAQKMTKALGTITTKYVATCADDDFLVPKTIEQCVHFLEDHPDYSIAHGLIVGTSFFESEGLFFTSTHQQRTIEATTPQSRLYDHYSAYTATFYSVHHRADLQHNMEVTSKHAFPVRLAELLPSGCSLIQGKAKCLDALYMVRGPGEFSTEFPMSWRKIMTLFQETPRIYEAFMQVLVNELTLATEISEEDARQVAEKAFHAYRPPTRKQKGAFSSWCHRLIQQTFYKLRILPDVCQEILIHHQLLPLLQAPKEKYHQLQQVRNQKTFKERQAQEIRQRQEHQKNDPWSLDQILAPQSPLREDFLPIYHLMQAHPKDLTLSSQNKKVNT